MRGEEGEEGEEILTGILRMSLLLTKDQVDQVDQVDQMRALLP